MKGVHKFGLLHREVNIVCDLIQLLLAFGLALFVLYLVSFLIVGYCFIEHGVDGANRSV